MEKQKCRKSELQTIETLENARQKIITLENTENQKLWRAERRNYGAYRPVLLFKSSCWKKADKKIGIFNKRVKIQAHDTSVGNKKLFMEKTLLIFTFAVCVGKKHTQWKQIGYKLLQRNLCTRQRKMNYDTKDFHLTITLTILLQEKWRRPTLLCQIKEKPHPYFL